MDASSKTNIIYWVPNMFNDATYTPYLYHRQSNGNIVLYNGNTGNLMSNSILNTESNNPYVFNINSSEVDLQYIKIGKVYTNLPYSASNFNFVKENLDSFKNVDDFEKANFMLYYQGKFHLLYSRIDLNNELVTIDLVTKESINDMELVTMSTLRKGDIL